MLPKYKKDVIINSFGIAIAVPSNSNNWNAPLAIANIGKILLRSIPIRMLPKIAICSSFNVIAQESAPTGFTIGTSNEYLYNNFTQRE